VRGLPLILFALLGLLSLRAQDTTGGPAAPAPTATPTATDDNDPAAHQGYEPPRYEDLWTKSPFAVETPDTQVTESAEYSFVGVAQLGNITYVSLVQKQNQAHLLVTSDKPLGDLKLDSISNKPDGVYASFTQNGQPLTLKLETAPAGVPQANYAAPAQNVAMPGSKPMMFNPSGVPGAGGQNIPMPGSFNPSTARPLIRIRRPLIHVPGRIPGPSGQPIPPTAPQ